MIFCIALQLVVSKYIIQAIRKLCGNTTCTTDFLFLFFFSPKKGHASAKLHVRQVCILCSYSYFLSHFVD